jgi:hypothetical protein
VNRRPPKLPAPEADGNIYVSEYLLRRWEHRGFAKMDWLDRKAETLKYTINGEEFEYGGIRMAPKVNERRRTFFQAVLMPMPRKEGE